MQGFALTALMKVRQVPAAGVDRDAMDEFREAVI